MAGVERGDEGAAGLRRSQRQKRQPAKRRPGTYFEIRASSRCASLIPHVRVLHRQCACRDEERRALPWPRDACAEGLADGRNRGLHSATAVEAVSAVVSRNTKRVSVRCIAAHASDPKIPRGRFHSKTACSRLLLHYSMRYY